MISRYFKALQTSSGGTPPPLVTYNPVCLTKSTETVGTQAFFRVTAVYTVSQDTTVAAEVQTSYNGGTETKTYSISRAILNGNTVSGNAKLVYTSGYPDEQFIGLGTMAFSPATDGGGRTFSNNGLCG